MLKRLLLHPYKVHKSLELDNLPSLALIVGGNNTGKSAILHAIALPKYGLRWDPLLPTAPISDPGFAADPVAELDYDFGRPSEPLRLRFAAPGNAQIHVAVQDAPSGSTQSGWNIPPPGQVQEFQLPLIPVEARTVFYLGPYRTVPSRNFGYEEFNRDLDPAGSRTWNVVHQLKANDDPRFQTIQNTMARLGFGIRTVRTPTARAGSGSIWLENYGRSDSLPYVGSGASAVLPVITQASLLGRGELFAVEEPELHLHQAALDELAGFFGSTASRGVQVLATTHSTGLFGALYKGMHAGNVPKDATVFLLDRTEGGETSVRRYSLEEYHAVRNAADEALRRPAREDLAASAPR